MTKQKQSGIDLSQAASNLGSIEESSQQSKEKKQPKASKVAQPGLTGRDDHLLGELRQQCKLHRTELNFLDSLDLPGAPYQYLWLGTGGAELAPLLPDVPPLSLEQIGTEADPQEFETASISLVGRNGDRLSIQYQDGTIERCFIDYQGLKHGPFKLYYPSLPYLENAPFKLGSHLLQQKGLFYLGQPCGPFELLDENGVCVGKGCYELVEATPDEPSKKIGPQQLRKFLKSHSQLDLVNLMIEPKSKLAKDKRWSRDLQPIKVCLNKIVVRYAVLSRKLPHGQIQSFKVGPERPCVLLQRHENETWLEACARTHIKVLALVQKQVNELQQAQRAAAQLLAPEQAATAEQAPKLVALQEQLAVPLHDDEVGTLIHQQCLELMGKQQPTELVAGCVSGGYAQALLDCLPRTTDGRYLLNGILVSSAAYFEEQCYSQQRAKPGTSLTSSNRADLNSLILMLAYRIHHQQNDDNLDLNNGKDPKLDLNECEAEADSPDVGLDALELSKHELSWLKAGCAPLLLEVENPPCTLKHWGEMQQQDRTQAWYRSVGHSSSLSQECFVNLSNFLSKKYFEQEAHSAQKLCGMHLGHYFCNGLALSNSRGPHRDAIPIWGACNVEPVSIDVNLDLLQHYFNWHATGCSSVYDAVGTYLGKVSYSEALGGLCHDIFECWHERTQTSEVGNCAEGQIQDSLTFTLYQDYRARFPAGIFTVNLAQSTFIGPYQRIYSIDELFDAGYHAVMLEVYDEGKTEEGTKRLKRLKNYQAHTYVQELGTYLEDDTFQVDQQYDLEPYQRPERSSWSYHDWDYDDEYEDELTEL